MKNSSPAAVSRPGCTRRTPARPARATCAAADDVVLRPARPGEPDQHRHEQHDADPADERPRAPERPGHARDGQPGHHHHEPDGGEHRPVRQDVAAEHGGRRGRGRGAAHAGGPGRPPGSGPGAAARYRPPRTRRDGPARRPSPRRRRTAPRRPRRRPPSAATSPRRVRRGTPHAEHAGPEHRGEPEDDRVGGPRTARDAGGHGVHPRTRTCRDQPHLGVISISMRFHRRATARAHPLPSGARRDRAAHSGPGTTPRRPTRRRGDRHLCRRRTTGATEATTGTETPAPRLPRARPPSTPPSTATSRRCSPSRARPAGRTRSSRSRPAERSPRRCSSPSGSAPTGDDGGRRPSSCAARRAPRPARWPARTTR